MRVLEVISDTNVGGAGRLLLSRLAHSNRTNIQTAVALPDESRLIPTLHTLGVEIHPLTHCADRSWDLRAVGELCALIRSHVPDVVHAHGCLSARVAATVCRVPVRIHTRHCCFPVSPVWQTPPLKQLCGAAQGLLSTGMIAVADAAAEDLRSMGVREERIRVIVNGTDALPMPTVRQRSEARERWGIPHDAFVAGLVARLAPCKGHTDLLRAARVLCRQRDNFYFLIAGEGEQETALRKLAQALQITDRVIFTGFLSDVCQAFYAMDLNVNCSYGTETSSLSLSEGMSIGLPCVVSDYGGNPYMVRHGENGYVYPVGDFPYLASLIAVLREDTALYRRMSQAARARYEEELTAERMTVLVEKYYAELLQKKSPVAN